MRNDLFFSIQTTVPRVPWRTGPRGPRRKLFLESELQTMRCGMHSEMYQRLGAHPEVVDGQVGVRFAVWAPNAREVSILCDQTHWTHGRFWLNSSDDGIWSVFMPGAKPGMTYKYGLVNAHGQYTEKSDPYAFYWEMRPKSASIVYDLEQYKWNDTGWMNDTLRYIRRDPIHRTHHQGDLSFRMVYAFSENFVLALSHDEVVHGKQSLLSQMPGDPWQKFANLRLLFGYQYLQPGKKLLFMGCELGQWHEWQHEGELDWALVGQHLHDGLRQLVGDLNALYRREPCLYERDFDPDGFQWLQCDDWQNSVFAFVRHGKQPGDMIVCVLNFTPVPRPDYRVGVPAAGYYGEILNSDAGIYGGANLGNLGGTHSDPLPMHGCQQSISIQLPPLAMVLFKPMRPKVVEPTRIGKS